MKYLENEFLGSLTYNGGWSKKDNIIILGKELNINIVFSAYENEDVNLNQVKSYLWLEQNQQQVSNKSLELMKKYLEVQAGEIVQVLNIKELPEDIYEIVQPKTILIQENGEIGMLCSTKWDSHGITVLIDMNRNIEVGPEDIIW